MSCLLHFVLFLLPSPALLLSQNSALQSAPQHVSRDTKQQPIKVVITESCARGEPPEANGAPEGQEVELDGESTVVLTHRIRVVPAVTATGPSCGRCDVNLAVIRERMERLEKEVSELREKCGGPDGDCCTSLQSKGRGCTTVSPPMEVCPDDCSDQGHCVEGQCECFPGFSGPDCSTSNCPGNCHGNGKCVDGQCVCDPGFTGLDCSETLCPRNCGHHGRCMNGVCVCDAGFTGPDCSIKACPKNCSNRGRCVNGKCVCDSGFTGPGCAARACPGNCNNRGRCVNGKCVCETGFTGPGCSEKSCPGNCNNRGQCVNGNCVCETGLAGPDCSEKSCPGNCNNRGQCVNGKCVCESSFTGADCSDKSCPGNCNNRGQCVNGKCVCESSFTGADCSDKSCPGNCNNRGQCVNGKCVCGPGFTGADCSSKSCPANCNDRGRCVDGRCVCDVDFAGPDCSTRACPKACSNRGRCVKGRCVCWRGSTGPDCSQCEDSFSGPNCTVVLGGVSNLSVKDITESSVTLFWTPPAVQYDTYHITFTSEKESDQKIIAKVSGKLSSYTQVGLAAGEPYTVTITGEKEGEMGAGSRAEFQTLISGPKNLQVVKTSTKFVIVQWEQAQGEIDRYLLFVSPNQTDGSGRKAREMRFPPERDSAQIEPLEPGQLYDISLIAERNGSRSLPVTVQATPGTSTKMNSGITEKSVATQVALGTDHSDGKTHGTKTNQTILLNQGEEYKRQRKPFKLQDLETSDGSRKPRLEMPRQGRPTLNGKEKVLPGIRTDTIRRQNIAVRFNGTRPGSGGGRLGHFPSKTLVGTFSAEGPKTKTPSVGSGLQYPMTGDNVVALSLKKTSMESDSKGSVNASQPWIKLDHSKLEPKEQVLESSTQGSQSINISEGKTGLANDPEPYRNISELTEEPLAPTITTEKNLTAYINGTKCVRKVLIGHRKIQFNGKVDGKPMTKNLTVIVGNINGNEILHKILTGRPEGVTDDVTPLNEDRAKLHGAKNKQKPSLDETENQEGTTGERNEEESVMEVKSFPTSHPTETFSQYPVKGTQKEALGTSSPRIHQPAYSITSPTSPLPTPHSKPALLPSQIQDQHTNEDQLLKDRHPSRTYFQKQPSFRQKFPNRSKSPGSTAPIIKDRVPSRPISVVMPEISTDRHPNKNIPSVPLSRTSAVQQETLEQGALISSESQPDDQGSFATSVRKVSTPPSSTKLPITVSSTYAEKMTEHTETKDKKVLPFRHVPFRGAPYTRPFQNNTRPFLNIPRRPNRTWGVHRPIPSSGMITDTITASKTTPHRQEDPEINNTGLNGSGPTFTVRKKNGSNDTFKAVGRGLEDDTDYILPRKQNRLSSTATIVHPELEPDRISSRQNGPRPNLRPTFTVKRKNDTINRLPPRFRTQIKTHATTIHRGPKNESKGELSTQTGIVADKGTSKTAERTNIDGVGGGSEDDINGILLRAPSSLNSSAVITHHQPETKINITSLNGSNHSRTIIMKRKNDTIIRLPPRLQTRIKPNGSTIYTGQKGSKDLKVEKGSTVDLLTYKDSSEGSKPGPLIDKDSSTDFNMQLPTEKDTSKDYKDARDAKDSRDSKDSKVLSTDKAADKNQTFMFLKGSEDGIDHVMVQNVTAKGFTLMWGAPIGMFKNFIINITEAEGERAGQVELENKGQEAITWNEDLNMGYDRSQEKGLEQTDPKKARADEERENALWSPPDSHIIRRNGSDGGVMPNLIKVLPGSARTFPVTDLTPQTAYSVSLFGKGPGLRSNIHHFIISTGPEPPLNLTFTEISESSLIVSWTRPRSPVSGFKVTYMHTKDGEPVSMAADSADSSLALSQLTPGSSYEVSVISLRGLDESDPIKDVVITLPDPPTDLDAINITDTKALLLWRPALATVDQYVIIYGSEEAPGSELTIKVSGNAVEQQLQALRSSTRYTVSINSLLGDLRSSGRATTAFTTASGPGERGEGPRDLRANQVKPRTAVLSWKSPTLPVTSYKLTYVTEGQEIKEVLVAAGVTEHRLSRLRPDSVYTAQLQGERNGLHTPAISTEFTTGFLRFPFPTDCSQELLNGEKESGVVEIFPGGTESNPIQVYCDMDTDGGGWTVFQRRKDGKINFFRGWHDYRKGFGELEGEFWLGNDLLHNLTTMTPMTLRVDLRSGSESAYAQYSTFSVDTTKKHYALQVSGYSGTAGDSMKYHDRRPFSTWDRDPQPFITRCAMSYRGGWWYRNCHEANLNGLYNTHTNHQGLIWTAWKGTDFSIPFSEMKLRPASFNPHT